ncbi:MAG TPA: aromatic ring-hydroxylating dioxygenase subunit alpha [Stellaceae bacterium]|nr:aromatic ring-hydroxylating dioxygenase subunit alpha [Stellaceae bacterium]
MTEFTVATLADVPLTPTIRSILDRLGPSTGDVKAAVSLPPECYTLPEWYEFERRAVFDRDWVALGHKGLAPLPGDYFSIRINDEPLLVVHGQDGVIRVMSAVCRHRGHVLGEARGNATDFTCPFHGWSYDLTGRLTSAPEMSGTLPFDELQRTQCLPVIRSEIWNGFIFMNMSGDAPPLATRLKVLTNEVRNHHMDELASVPTIDWSGNPWNWKFMQENAIEPYHTHYLHHGPHDFAPSRLASFFDWDEADDGAIFHPTGFVEIDGGFNISTKCLMPVIKTLTPAERQRVMFATVAPNLFFGAQPDTVFYFVIIPESAGSITLRVGLLVPPETMALPTFEHLVKATVDGISIFNDADVQANIKTHLGLQSRFAARTRYAPKEKTLPQFNNWLAKRYRAYGRHLGYEAVPA